MRFFGILTSVAIFALGGLGIYSTDLNRYDLIKTWSSTLGSSGARACLDLTFSLLGLVMLCSIWGVFYFLCPKQDEQ